MQRRGSPKGAAPLPPLPRLLRQTLVRLMGGDDWRAPFNPRMLAPGGALRAPSVQRSGYTHVVAGGRVDARLPVVCLSGCCRMKRSAAGCVHTRVLVLPAAKPARLASPCPALPTMGAGGGGGRPRPARAPPPAPPPRPPTHRPTHPPLLPTAGGPAPYGRRAEWALVLQSGCDVLSIRWLGRCYAEGALVEPAASEYLRISEATLKVGHLPPVGCLHSRPSAAFTAAARAPQESPRRPRPWWPARSQRSAGSPQLGPVRRRLLRRGERGAHASCSALCCCTACHAYCLFVVADCPDRGDMACSPSAAADKHGTASSSLPQPHHHHPTPPHPTPPD